MEKRSDAALVALRQILRAIEFNARSLAHASGLTPSQLIVLQFLAHRDESTPSEIAKHISLTQATVTSLIDKLEAQRLVTRRRDDKDRRRIIIKISRRGRNALETSPDALQQRFQKRFGALANWEQASIVASLERIAALLNAQTIEAGPILDIGALDQAPDEIE